MYLVIDNRERDLISSLESLNIDFDVKNLDLGDICFYEDENYENLYLLIERKTISDLVASIKDGRYREQKTRMKGSGIKMDRIIYLIDGVIKDKDNEKIIYGSMINMQLRDNIKIYKSLNINETTNYIIRIFEKIKTDDVKEYFLYYDDTKNKEISNVEYVQSLKKKKKENMTSENWFIYSLSQMPRITENLGDIIYKKYNSISNLVNAYEELDNEIEREKLLENIKVSENKKLGKVLSKRIYDYIYGKL
jgi:crossover junction endonuclease MUS81